MRFSAFLGTAFIAASPLPVHSTTPIAQISQHPVVRLTENDRLDWMPTLSADGHRLAWSGEEGGPVCPGCGDIYIADRVNGAWQDPVRFGLWEVAEGYPDLTDDGAIIVYAAGHRKPFPGRDEIQLREYTDGTWGSPVIIANTRNMDYSYAEKPVISGDGTTVVARFDKTHDYDSFIIQRADGGWGKPTLLDEKGRFLALNADGTRVCTGDLYTLDVHDLTGATPRTWRLEDRVPHLGNCTISSDGGRVAYPLSAGHHKPWSIRLRELRHDEWEVTEFRDFRTGTLSGDGNALLFLAELLGAEIYLSRFLDGEWHEPACIADTGVSIPMPCVVSRDGTKVAFEGATRGRSPESQEIFFLEYDFPGKAVVKSNIAEAPFTLSGPIELSRTTGPGCRWECDQLYVSTWTVTWGEVPFYETPLAQTQRTAVDETVYFFGKYVPAAFRLGPDEVGASVGSPVLNYATGTFFVRVEITNLTEDTTFFSPMRLVFDSLSPEGTNLWNGDGYTEDGKTFIDLSRLIPDGLAPGSDPLVVEVELYNRERNPNISFEAFVTAAKAPRPENDCGSQDLPPRAASAEGVSISYRFKVKAITSDDIGVKIVWQSFPDKTYRVLCREDFSTLWRAVADVEADGEIAEWIDNSVSAASPRMRIYRVQAIPSLLAPEF